MRTQEPAGQSAPPSSYPQYPRQVPPQQPPPNSFQQDSYPNPQRQQADPRLNPQPPSEQQQQPPSPADWAEGSHSRGAPLDQSQSSGAYGQGHTGRRHVEPVNNPPYNMGNEASEFGMGRRGRGGGGGQNASRGQTPPSSSAAAGTGAASVMALGQNKLPQRAEVPPWVQCTCWGCETSARWCYCTLA